MKLNAQAICLLLYGLMATPLLASTWYVRPDGGTRYSSNVTSGQCDGTADAPYPGSGTNRHCAFKDVRSLFQDGSYDAGKPYPAWGWIGKGGDTYILRGSIQDGISYRIGWENPANAYDPKGKQFFGMGGDPYGSGIPTPPSGTASQHTRILGANYASCRAASAKTQLHGGYATGTVLNMAGASYVDVACLDITDFSDCGRATQSKGCNSDINTLTDFATNGIGWSNQSTHDSLTDIHIHGLAGSGMSGPTGDDMHFQYLDILGNASAGWNADPGNGDTGHGTLLVQHYNISWNGCAEEYPIKHALPYADCTDDNGGGYGDGFGTTTAPSRPGWKVTFDQGVVSYNTQDGLDALHIGGDGSVMTVSHTLAFGNMGQQIKVGGAAGVITDNKIITNCNAMRESISGTPAGYNSKLSDFCRAADTGVLITVNNDVPTRFTGNTVFSASATGVEVECAYGTCGSTSRIDFSNNIFVGFRNDAAHGYARGGSNEYSNPIYLGVDTTNPFTNAGSTYSGNTTFHGSSNWHCPAKGERNARCTDPHLADQTWHNFGHGDMSPAKPGAASIREPGGPSAINLASVARLRNLRRHPVRLRNVACLCAAGVLGAVGWQGLRGVLAGKRVSGERNKRG